MGQFCVWIIRCCNGSCSADGIWVVVVVEVDVGSLLLLLHDKKAWGENDKRAEEGEKRRRIN